MTILNPTPAIDVIISPTDSSICQGNPITLTANYCAGCTYAWSFNSIPTGDTTQSITVKPNASGYYNVTITNSTSSNTSYRSNITVKQSPAIPTITGSTTICQGNYNLLTANTNGCTDCTYLWSPGGQTDSSIYVNTAGTYSVTTNNGCFTGTTSLPKTLTVVQPPAVPVVTVNPGCHFITPLVNYTTYQWEFNDTVIPGETSRFLIVLLKQDIIVLA